MMMTAADTHVSPIRTIEQILAARLDGEALSDKDVEVLLGATGQHDLELLFSAARTVRARAFGDVVFLYGFVYFSTYCKNACAFCYYRATDGASPRYRKSIGEVVEAAGRLRDSGVDLIDLTMGEDPYFLDDPDALPALVRAVADETHLAIMVSPGAVGPGMLHRLRAAGADWYALYQESYDPALYSRLRLGQPADRRIRAKRQARRAGLLVEEGLMTGFGEPLSSFARSVAALRGVDAQQVRVMTFVPQAGTPLAGIAPADSLLERKAIAVMRLLFPGKLIPASLDVDGLAGLRGRLDAGANVVTSIIPPQTGLAGVAQAEADIDNGARTVAGIADTLELCGLVPATPAQYRAWIEGARPAAPAAPAARARTAGTAAGPEARPRLAVCEAGA